MNVVNSKYSKIFGLFLCDWHTPEYSAEFGENRSSHLGNNEQWTAYILLKYIHISFHRF